MKDAKHRPSSSLSLFGGLRALTRASDSVVRNRAVKPDDVGADRRRVTTYCLAGHGPLRRLL